MRAALSFLSGAILMWLLLAFVFAKTSSGEIRSKGADAATLGVLHSYGDAARALAGDIGIVIPQDGVDCFYSIGGINPVLEFVAYTVPKDRVWSSVTFLTGKKKSESHVALHARGPEVFGEECRTVLYDLSRVSTPLAIDWKLKKGFPGECIIDELSGRVFILVSPE